MVMKVRVQDLDLALGIQVFMFAIMRIIDSIADRTGACCERWEGK